MLCGSDKHLRGICIPLPNDVLGEQPIIAGRIGGLSSGEEFITMEFELIPLLEARLCHVVRIAVLADNGESRLFTVGHTESVLCERLQ